VSSTPMFTAGTSIVLGRRAMARLFRATTYDSSTASFSVVFGSELPETIRVVLAIAAILQTFILARYIVSPYNLSMRKLVLTPIKEREMFFANNVKVTAFECVGIALALIQSSIGFLYVGYGFGVDYDLASWLWICSLITLCLVVTQSVIWVLFTWLIWGGGNTRGLLVTSAVCHSLYASTAAMGLVVGFLPAGAISMLPLLTAFLVGLVFVIPNLLYNAMMVVLFAVANVVKSTDNHFRWCLVHVLVQLLSFGLFSWGWAQYIAWPLVSAWNVRFGSDQEPMVAYVFLTLAVVAVMWLIFGEARHLFDQYVTGFNEVTRKKGN
jgi:hypothetical protein